MKFFYKIWITYSQVYSEQLWLHFHESLCKTLTWDILF